MTKKKIDIRVELLSYLNEKNQIEYYPNFGYPIELFVLLQNCNINIYTKENLNSSDFIVFVSTRFLPLVAVILKKLVFLGNYTLYDIFGWNNNNNINQLFYNSNKNSNNFNVILFNLAIFLSMYLDIKVFVIQPNKNFENLHSISRIYSSATWLERENSEMFNLNYTNLSDSRKLLLDYTISKGILLKGVTKSFFSFYFKNKVGVYFF